MPAKITAEKVCKQCQETKPLSAFDSNGRVLRGKCRACRRENKLDPALADYVPETAETIRADRKAKREDTDARQQRDLLAAENERLHRLLDTMRELPPAKPVVFTAQKHDKGEAVPLWDASDWHVEEHVDSNKVQGLNHFDLKEAEARAQRFFVNGLRLTSMAARDSVIKKILLVLGGDFFSNGIHEELLETNQLGPTHAVAFVRDLLSSGIRHILKTTDLDIELACVVGNHGRITKKLRFSTATENNLEYLLYQWLASEFANEKRVKFHICPGTMQFVNLFDNYLIRIVHGYEIKSGGGIGGITIPIRKKIAGWDMAKQADLTVIHHFHQMLDGGNFLVNGSLIGYNEYCQVNGFSPEQPQQTFALIHSRNGGEKSIVAPIWVTEEGENK